MAKSKISPPKQPDGVKKKQGRPTIYSEELANRICQIVATNVEGLPTLCNKFDEMPHEDTIKQWRWEKPLFSAKYAEAKRFQAELMAESLEELMRDAEKDAFHDEHGNRRLDSGLLGLARLRVDTRKWQASKLAPKIYGDKQTVSTTVTHESTIKDLE
jgi:hypothetical protein